MLPLADDRLCIASRTRAGSILCSPSKRAGLRYLVSIGSATDAPPAGIRNVPVRLRLVFDDEESAERGGPDRGHVERLVAFGRAVDFGTGRLLVHCQAGISRSSAAALIVLAARLGPGVEEHAAAFVKRLFPASRPNRRMLELADDVLASSLLGAWQRIAGA